MYMTEEINIYRPKSQKGKKKKKGQNIKKPKKKYE